MHCWSYFNWNNNSSFCLTQGPSTPAKLMVRVIQCGYHVCSKQDSLSYFKGLKMNIFGLWQKERVSMTITLWILFGFFCDEYFWCQVWRISAAFTFPEIFFIQYFSIFKLQTLWHHHFPNLHNAKTLTSVKEKRYSKKENAILISFESISNKQQLFFIS